VIVLISGVVIWIVAFWMLRASMKLNQATIGELRRDRLRAVILRPGESFSASIELPAGVTDDYPHLRAHPLCPLCDFHKDAGLIVCWACYKLHHFRTGISAEILARLEAEERREASSY
jgi:hypothetical protein